MKLTINNITVNAGFSFFATAALFLSAEMSKNYLICLFFSLLHEFGHLVAMISVGCSIKEISFGSMGIKITKSNLTLSYLQECMVALCGPVVNLIFIIVLVAFKDNNELFYSSFNINLGLFIVNLFPISMLDGGRIVKFFLLNFVSEETVNKSLDLIDILVSLMLITVLIFALIYKVGNEYFVFFIVCMVGITVFDMFKHK